MEKEKQDDQTKDRQTGKKPTEDIDPEKRRRRSGDRFGRHGNFDKHPLPKRKDQV